MLFGWVISKNKNKFLPKTSSFNDAYSLFNKWENQFQFWGTYWEKLLEKWFLHNLHKK